MTRLQSVSRRIALPARSRYATALQAGGQAKMHKKHKNG